MNIKNTVPWVDKKYCHEYGKNSVLLKSKNAKHIILRSTFKKSPKSHPFRNFELGKKL